MSKFAFVAVIGTPNAGKSTLVNQLTGAKVSIVTPKPQTTRNCIKGIGVFDDTQLVFIDTPGIFSNLYEKGGQKLAIVILKAAFEEVGNHVHVDGFVGEKVNGPLVDGKADNERV